MGVVSKSIAAFCGVAAIFCGAAEVPVGSRTYQPFEKYEFSGPKYGIMHNEDCTQFFYTFKYPATEEGLKQYIDECYLAPGHQIREFLLNPQAQRFGYQSRVGDSFIDALTFTDDGRVLDQGVELNATHTRAMKRFKTFADAGINPWMVWTRHLRERGVSPWISIRMNDMHAGPDHSSRMNSEFYKQNTDKLIAPYRGDWAAHGLDFTHPEVRKYMLDCIQETLDLCEPDGLDLDFMRFGTAFRRGHEQRGREIMNEFIREVRRRVDALAEKSGHPVRLSVRIHSDPRDAYAFGFDPGVWAEEGLIDILAVGPFFDSSFHEIPIREWRRIVGDQVLIAASVETSAKGYPGADRIWDAGLLNGLAALYFHEGADRIYLFNHFGNQYDNMSRVGDPDLAAAAVRRHALMYNDMPAPGRIRECHLPSVTTGWSTFRLDIGPEPAADRPVLLVLGSNTACPGLQVRFNGEILQKADGIPAVVFGEQIRQLEAWVIPHELLQSQGNIIEAVPEKPVDRPYRIDWVEIYIGKPGEKLIPGGTTAAPKTLAPTVEQLAGNGSAAFRSDYGSGATAANGVLTLNNDQPQNAYAVIRITDPDFTNPGKLVIEIRGEMRLYPPAKSGDAALQFGAVLPDAAGKLRMLTVRVAPDRVSFADGKFAPLALKDFCRFKVVFKPENGTCELTVNDQTISGNSVEPPANAVPGLFFGDGSGGVSGKAELRNLEFQLR